MKNLISPQITKQGIKSMWILVLVLSFVISINLLAIPSGFGSDADALGILQMFANTGIAGNGVIFTIVTAVLCANVFLTSGVDRGTLSVYLNTPTTRSQILFSRILVFAFVLMGMVIITGIFGSISALLQVDDFNHGKWWTIIALWALYSFLLGGIAFAIGCWFNKSRHTLLVCAFVLGSTFILAMLTNINNFEFLRFFTPQTLMNMDAVLNGDSVLWQLIVMPIAAIPFYVIGFIKFVKKDLPL